MHQTVADLSGGGGVTKADGVLSSSKADSQVGVLCRGETCCTNVAMPVMKNECVKAAKSVGAWKIVLVERVGYDWVRIWVR